ncbi:Serine/threonine-protein like [Actinidia chinensis var. chinensis]|uniref:Serine/threonine-protein like n=1 Tax=Actinidia chinensis var. chinensis TaxID=1590841 RepID=A0A2R6QHD3_ACTCC|nr:Serine/threonine-protein like [Actinidia chinensis var. chinensis]
MGVPSWGRWSLLIPKISTTSSRADLNSARKPFELSTTDKPRGRVGLLNATTLAQEISMPASTRTHPQVPSWEEGITSSCSTYTFSDNEEEEREEAINQLVLNKRRNWVILMAEPEVPNAKPIPISSSDNEHSNDLTYTPLQLVGEVEVAHSFWKGDKYDTSSGSVKMAPRFKTLV